MGEREEDKVITLDSLSKHNTEADCWIAVHQKVWDITDFVAEHPGGSAGELSPSSGEMRTRKPHSKERIMRGAEAEEGIV